VCILVVVCVSLSTNMKVFAVSDLHVDYKENKEWCDDIPEEEHLNDVIIVAGDVSHDIKKLEETLLLFRRKFDAVFYVPGNHELWVRNGDPSIRNSIDKFEEIISLCKRIGVHVSPHKVGNTKKVWVVPLFAWYHENLDSDEDDYDDEKTRDTLKGWTDFLMCKWPTNFIQHPLNPHESRALLSHQTVSPKDYFAALNAPHMHPYDAPVISFSHFVPRRDLLPPKEFLFIPFLTKVSGALEIEKQLRQINSTIHVFGHTHIQCHNTKDGVYYVQNALAYPRERKHLNTPVSLSRFKIWDDAE